MNGVNRLLMAYEIGVTFHGPAWNAEGGYNSFLLGDSSDDGPSMPDGGWVLGWQTAYTDWLNGKLYARHVFPHPPCKGRAFLYGGTFVCNDCGANKLERPWWVVRVEKDGNAFCCKGEGFEDLQASDNYAFGDTFDSALANYAEKFFDMAPMGHR